MVSNFIDEHWFFLCLSSENSKLQNYPTLPCLLLPKLFSNLVLKELVIGIQSILLLKLKKL